MAEVTCVIPTHARDTLLAEAIASVVAQDLRPAELVVSDDVGSPATRATVEAAATTARFPVRYVDSSGPAAGTAGASRNAGAAHAHGDVLAFLDDDDLWEPTFLTRLVGALEEQQADFAVGWTRAEASGRYEIARMPPGLTAQDVVARNPGFVGSNFVMRSAAFRRIGGFDPALPVSNDKDLLVRALLAGLTYAVVPEVLLRNRIHTAGQLTDKTPRRLAGIRQYRDKHAALLGTQDRRYLRAQALSVQRALAPSPVSRFAYGVLLAGERTLYQLADRRRPAGRR